MTDLNNPQNLLPPQAVWPTRASGPDARTLLGPFAGARPTMKTVLLLEDDEISRALYQRVLGRQWSILVGESPNQALQLLLVSGTPPEGLTDGAFKCFEDLVATCVFDYLEKPFTPTVLNERVAALVDGQHNHERIHRRLADAQAYRQWQREGKHP